MGAEGKWMEGHFLSLWTPHPGKGWARIWGWETKGVAERGLQALMKARVTRN